MSGVVCAASGPIGTSSSSSDGTCCAVDATAGAVRSTPCAVGPAPRAVGPDRCVIHAAPGAIDATHCTRTGSRRATDRAAIHSPRPGGPAVEPGSTCRGDADRRRHLECRFRLLGLEPHARAPRTAGAGASGPLSGTRFAPGADRDHGARCDHDGSSDHGTHCDSRNCCDRGTCRGCGTGSCTGSGAGSHGRVESRAARCAVAG
jgi:hypothetical protein